MKKILSLLISSLAFTTVFAANITETIDASGNFKTLAKALKISELDTTLKGAGPFTVFAPTDAAFAKIPKEKLDALLKDKAALTKVLTYHVVSSKTLSSEIQTGKVKSVEGSLLTFKIDDGKVKVNKARVSKADMIADNGVIHAIDQVLLDK
jgi:uncharacterized surface protein with fasciclin (FAS1) repeats